MGDARSFLGMAIQRNRGSRKLSLSQADYTCKLVDKFDYSDAKHRDVPLSPSIQLTKLGKLLKVINNQYAKLVGAALYLSSRTRPDIAQAVSALSRYTAAPTTDHWAAALVLLRYLKGTANLGLPFGHAESTQRLEMVGFCDADWGGEKDDS
eukprot:363744-Chlamydomonas_euryale.AAC.3